MIKIKKINDNERKNKAEKSTITKGKINQKNQR